MHRLFVAIRPPKQVRDQLLRIMGSVGGVRWQTDEQLHLTLRFIGEVGRHCAEDVAAALGAIHHPPFELALHGLGMFESRGQPETLWAGVTPHDQLRGLHKKADQACVRVGLEPERRAYNPHITLGRLKRGAGPVESLLASAGGATSPPFEVTSFALFESQLTPDGAVYSLIERYALA